MRSADANEPSRSDDLIARCKAAVARARAIAASTRGDGRQREAMAADMRKLRQNGARLIRKLEKRTATARKRLEATRQVSAKTRHRKKIRQAGPSPP